MNKIPISETEKKRLELVNVANGITRLADREIFPTLLEAVNAEDRTKFKGACRDAFIPDDMEKYLWHILMKKTIKKAKTEPPQDAAFCW